MHQRMKPCPHHVWTQLIHMSWSVLDQQTMTDSSALPNSILINPQGPCAVGLTSTAQNRTVLAAKQSLCVV